MKVIMLRCVYVERQYRQSPRLLKYTHVNNSKSHSSNPTIEKRNLNEMFWRILNHFMHPLKKDEHALINKMKFETKNVLEHLNRVADQSKKINRQEIERRLTELSRYSKELALIQRKIDLEIERET